MPLDLALTNYNQHTGRFNFASGPNNDVLFDSTQAYAVQTAVGCVKRAYHADQTIGSDLSTLKHATSKTPSQAIAMCLDALDPLVRANLISPNPQATANKIVNFVTVLSIDLTWSTPGGAQQSGSVQL